MIIEIKMVHLMFYSLKMPLNNSSGGSSFKSSSSNFFHEGIVIGNGNKMLYSDYGVDNEEKLHVRFWDSNHPKDQWRDVKNVGSSRASNDQVKNIFFGQQSEQWTNPYDYSLASHNCQHYAKQVRNNLMKYQ